MTRQPFERTLRIFVSDVPEHAPRDLLEAVLIDLPTVKQRRRRFGLGRRFQPMSSPLRALAVAAAVLVVAVAGYSMLGNRIGPGASPTLAPSPTPTAAPTRSPAPTASPRISGATGATVNEEGDPGTTYVLSRFEPVFTYAGLEGMLFAQEGPTHAWFVHGTSFAINAGVVQVGKVFDEAGATLDPPADLAAWVQARTDLTVTATTTVTLGTAEGTLIEATVADDAFTNGGGAINVFCPASTCAFEQGGSMGYAPGDRVLILVTAVDGLPVAAMGTAPEADWATYGARFDAWLRSFDFPG